MKRVAVLGSTGSIGRSALDVIASHPDRLSLVSIAARSRVDDLARQAREHRPARVGLLDETRAASLRALAPVGIEIATGVDGLCRLATDPDVDIVVFGTSGREALHPLIEAIKAGKQVALASKELLVMAGDIIMRLVRESHATLIPIDSEHAGLFQALQGIPREQVERITVTGTGGPLWPLDADAIAGAPRAVVLRHPKWQMGPKITVDSATLMNKGLEVIEARWLFGLPLARIDVRIHPQAVVHAIVECVDGSCLAQLAICDMRVPIQYALSYPERWPSALPRLRLTEASGLEFFEPDLTRFPCLAVALDAARIGGTACAVLSAANDVAVEAFLADGITLGQVPELIRRVLDRHRPAAAPGLEEILRVDEWARTVAREQLGQLGSAAASVSVNGHPLRAGEAGATPPDAARHAAASS